MKNSFRIFETPSELSSTLAKEITERIIASANKERPYSISLSGGSTPELLYSFLFDEFVNAVPWEFVHLFWGDERCVLPDHPESNYGNIQKFFNEKTGLSIHNIHRIRGEDEPETEAARYSAEISAMLPSRDGLPVFDLILLGMGEDGHTASIFPDQMQLLDSERICGVAIHPVSGQNRITLTGKVINNAEAVVILVTGVKKAQVIGKIFNNAPEKDKYPVSHIKPVYGSLDWYLDREAATLSGLSPFYSPSPGQGGGSTRPGE
jgi:6-phosphogluconolactonase